MSRTNHSDTVTAILMISPLVMMLSWTVDSLKANTHRASTNDCKIGGLWCWVKFGYDHASVAICRARGRGLQKQSKRVDDLDPLAGIW